MKTLNVSWKTDQPVPVEITTRNPQQLSQTGDKKVIRAPAAGNVIIITCSGGVLRHWPRL